MAGEQGDHGVARRGIEGDRAQECAGPVSPGETRAVELIVSLRDLGGVSDSLGKSLADDFRRQFCAAERELNAAACKWIDERARVTYRDYAGNGTPAPICDWSRADPFAVNYGVEQSAPRRRIRPHRQIEQFLPIPPGFAQRGLGRDEAQVGPVVFHIDHSAVTVAEEEQFSNASHSFDRAQVDFASE